MVPFVIPGERVSRIFVTFKIIRRRLRRSLEASPDRIEPKCPLYSRCGGCQYQHIDLATLEDLHVEELMQNRWSFKHLTRLTSYSAKDAPFTAPIKKVRSPSGLQYGRNQIIDVEHCPIATDAINAALPDAREEARRSGGRRQRGGTLFMRRA